jgi:CRP-like cAMP-binding protein
MTLFRKPSPFALDLMRLFHLSAREAAAAEKIFTTVEVPAGTELSWEGSSTRQLVLILDGEVEVTRNGEHVTTLGPGSVLGEITALGVRHEQTASATTTVPSRIAAAGTHDIASIRGVTGLYLHMQHLVSVRTLQPTS